MNQFMDTHITLTGWVAFTVNTEDNVIKSIVCERVFTSEKEAREYAERNPGVDLVTAPLIIEKSIL